MPRSGAKAQKQTVVERPGDPTAKTEAILGHGFSTLALYHLELDRSLLWGGCVVHCRMLSSTLGLYPFDASSTPLPGVTNKSVSRHCQISQEGKTTPSDWEPLIYTIRGPPNGSSLWTLWTCLLLIKVSQPQHYWHFGETLVYMNVVQLDLTESLGVTHHMCRTAFINNGIQPGHPNAGWPPVLLAFAKDQLSLHWQGQAGAQIA